MNSHAALSEANLQRMIDAQPKVLRNGVIMALRKVETAIQIVGAPGDAFAWLKRYRERMPSHPVAWWGMHPGMSPYVEKLDEAFQLLRDYKWQDYTPKDARKQVRKNDGALGGRPPGDVTDDQIIKWLLEKGYARSNNKKEIVLKAEEEIGVKKTSVVLRSVWNLSDCWRE